MHSLGRCAASQGDWSWERFGRVLGKLRKKFWRTRVERPGDYMKPGPGKSIEHETNMLQKSCKMAPKWLRELPREPEEHGTHHGNPILPSREPPKSPLEASGSGKSILSVPSGGPWAEKWSDFTLPEAPWEGPGEPSGRHFGNIFAARPAGMQKVRNSTNVRYFWRLFFSAFFMFFLRLPRGAGARAHLENIGFGVEGMQNFACRPLSRGTRRQHNS